MNYRAGVLVCVHTLSCVVTAGILIGCGGETTPRPVVPAADSGGPVPTLAPHHDGMQVEGILGTIRQSRIEETLHAELPAFQRCFFEGAEAMPSLAGYMHFYFHVGLDGRVEWVQPHRSNVGRRETELCLLGRAKRVRFPEPKGGGPAEFAWGFEFEAPDDVKKPVAWEPARVTEVLEQHRSELQPCQIDEASHYVVTLYVAPGGHVSSAGAAMSKPAASDQLDCISQAVSQWQFPDPGPSAAKVSFPL